MAKQLKKAQVNSIHYLQMMKDNFTNVKLELEIDIKNSELKRFIPKNKARLKEVNREINDLSNCIDWLKNL